MLRSSWLHSLSLYAAVLAGIFPCHAGDAPRFETYVTADYSDRAVALASSTVWSFLGPIDQPGFRLKVDGFANVYGETDANVFSSAFMAANIQMLGDVTAGYQLNWHEFWIKFYAGAAYQAQARIFWQAGQAVQQQSYGGTAAIESYWRGSGNFWASANLSWLQFDNTVTFYERGAYEILHCWDGFKLSAGAEAGGVINNANTYQEGRRLDLYKEYVREGALLNLRYWSHDLTLSGGFGRGNDESIWRPYATLSYGKKF